MDKDYSLKHLQAEVTSWYFMFVYAVDYPSIFRPCQVVQICCTE